MLPLHHANSHIQTVFLQSTDAGGTDAVLFGCQWLAHLVILELLTDPQLHALRSYPSAAANVEDSLLLKMTFFN